MAKTSGTTRTKAPAPTPIAAVPSKEVSARVAEPKSPAKAELLTVPFTIDGRELKLCLDPAALADAEQFYTRQGKDLNLLQAFLIINYGTCRQLFACSLRPFHPEITYDEAIAMLTPAYAGAVGALFAAEITRNLPAPTVAA